VPPESSQRFSGPGCGAAPLALNKAVLASLIHDVPRYISEYGYLAVGLGILLEDFGLPVPGETLLITGAAAASRGTLDMWWLLPVAWAGAVIGDNIGFLIGHFGGQKLLIRYGFRIGITHERLARVEHFVAHYGPIVIVFARFIVLLRQLNGIAAGSLGMHWLRFLVCNALGAALWVGFWGTFIYWLGKGVFKYVHDVESFEPALLAGIVLVFLFGLVYFWLRRKRRKTPDDPV
jgi:membrane protein DedA with SNARE-associated domain